MVLDTDRPPGAAATTPSADPAGERGEPGEDAAHPRDARIGAVLAVMRGAPLEAVAAAWEVDPVLLPRWVGAFVDAGTAVVTNRPDPAQAAERNRFLAAFAFELRAPLAEAISSAGRLAGSELRVSEVERAAEEVQSSLEGLRHRLAESELLVAAALGSLSLDRRRITVGELCAPLGEVGVTGRGPDYELEVDAAHFSRVVRDLWQASALGPEFRSRRLNVMVRGPWAELRVIRQGDPIDVETLQALFEPFVAEDLGTATSTGLYLARALTVAHGGTIGLEQNDRGTAFWVRVPLASDADDDDADGPDPTTTPDLGPTHPHQGEPR